MRILLVHNHYGSENPSGENKVFEIEKELLVKRGNTLLTFEKFSDSVRTKGTVGKIQAGISTIWSFKSRHEFKELAEEFQPDIIHTHNTFPLISTSIFSSYTKAAHVMTLHNYRIYCAAAVPLRNNVSCTECIVGRNSRPSIVNGCYKNSRIATIPLAVNIAINRAIGTWSEIDAYIALTDFQAGLMASGGLPPERIHIKHNYYDGTPTRINVEGRRNEAVFAGRLDKSKGVDVLIRAWNAWGAEAPVLNIIGDGPMKSELIYNVGTSDRILFHGLLSSSETEAIISRSKAIIVPSIWFEGYPLVIREALALGVPIIASRIGSLAEIVTDAVGYTFTAGSDQDLLRVLRQVWQDQAGLIARSEAAQNVFDSYMTEDYLYEKQISIYERAIQVRGQRKC